MGLFHLWGLETGLAANPTPVPEWAMEHNVYRVDELELTYDTGGSKCFREVRKRRKTLGSVS